MTARMEALEAIARVAWEWRNSRCSGDALVQTIDRNRPALAVEPRSHANANGGGSRMAVIQGE